LKSFWEIPFLVVDLETSGSHHIENGITEIACVTTIGGEITNVFSSLVNPHDIIPPFISQMTGITNLMVSEAPELSYVMPQIQEIFIQKDAVFVAHNARFDWSFISESFRKTNIEVPRIPRLCTLKLSRRILPKHVKKNLGELSEYFGVKVKNRHRAFGDAIATAHILNDMLQLVEQEQDVKTTEQLLFFQNKRIRNFKAPKGTIRLLESELNKLPDEPGVYKFLNQSKEPHFIGSTKSLKNHVSSYFSHEIMTSKKIAEMIGKTYAIEWETTGSELSAILMREKLSQSIRPIYNVSYKPFKHKPWLRLTKNSLYPILEVVFKPSNDGAVYFGPYKDVSLAYKIMQTVESKFKIRKCTGNLTPSDANAPCIHFHLKNCDAPCAGYINHDTYSEEIVKVEQFLKSYPLDIVNQLERQLENISTVLEQSKAENLKNQLVELRELFGRKYYDNTIGSNLIYLNQQSAQEKTLETFIFHKSRLIHQSIIGRNSSLDELLGIISEYFFNPSDLATTAEDIEQNDLKILETYLKGHQNNGTFLYPEHQSESTFLNKVIENIRNFGFDPSTT